MLTMFRIMRKRLTLFVVVLYVGCGMPIVLGESGDISSVEAVTSISDELSFDEHGKLHFNYLLYPFESAGCPVADFKPWGGVETNAVSGEALDLVFPGYQSGECVAAYLEKGTDQSLAGYTMPNFHYNSSVIDDSFHDWFTEACARKEVCLMNYYTGEDETLDIYWIKDGTNEERLTRELKYGEQNTACISSYLGHIFEARYGGMVVESFAIEHILVKSFGVTKSPDTSQRSFKDEIVSALRAEWGRHKVVKRTFSALGFAKGRLPKDVFAAMGSFYHNNRNNKVNEEWGGRGVFVNWWETEVKFIQIPWELKKIWQLRLSDLVSTWAGVPVEETVMYGLRQYEEGARLLTHVDRLATHAISLIVNVAQGNLATPWPVEVHDHADRLHEVLMEPGDIVYYESAKNLHGRNRSLQGKNGYYVNLFTHYRPIGDGDSWHSKLDQPGVPPPVMETSGECHLDPTATAVPALGQVLCEDYRLGSYLSPSLMQAKGPEDLIDWWRRTTPDYVEGIANEELSTAPVCDKDNADESCNSG